VSGEKDWNDAFRDDPEAPKRAGDNARRWKPNGDDAADNQNAGDDNQNADDEPRLILSSRDFVSGYIAPQYMIEGIVQQRRIYSLTGKTGDGKTAVQLYLAYLLASAAPLGTREVEQCRVLYLAGENPDDVRARWLAMSDVLRFDADTIPVHFVEGVVSVSGTQERIAAEAEKLGGFGAVIVDTSAAYFEGDEENDNVQLGNHARLLRKLTELPGSPGVLVGCHPIKSGENLLPRGGGAFLAEVDGNLTCKKLSDEIIELHWSGKYRGSSFEPVLFKVVTITSELVKDAKGRLIPSVMVRLTDDATLDDLQDQIGDDQEQVLVLLDTTPGMSQAKMAEAFGWVSRHGPDKAKVNRALAELVKRRLAEKDMRGRYSLTDKGRTAAKKLRRAP
jgi:AAA domain